MRALTQGFWHFACDLYQRDSAEHAFLWLQDNASLDVTSLLLCCWLATHYGERAEQHIESLLADASLWSQQLVRPLRRARYWYRNLPEAQQDPEFYRQLKDVELAGEKALILRLEHRAQALFGSPGTGCADVTLLAERLIHLYLAGANIRLSDEGHQQLARIVTALADDPASGC